MYEFKNISSEDECRYHCETYYWKKKQCRLWTYNTNTKLCIVNEFLKGSIEAVRKEVENAVLSVGDSLISGENYCPGTESKKILSFSTDHCK